MRKHFIITVLAFLLLQGICFGETVYLKTGSQIKGTIVHRDDKKVKVNISGIEITYYRDEIDHIEGEDAMDASAPAPAAASPSLSGNKQDLIVRLIEVNGTRAQMIGMFEEVIAQAPEEEKGALRQIFDIDDIIQELIPIYERYYTKEDLSGLVSFYESPLGQKMRKVIPRLMEDSMKASLAYFQRRARQFGSP